MASENYQLSKLNPAKRAAREAAIARVSKRTGIPAMNLMCGKKQGRILVIERGGCAMVLDSADDVNEIK